MSKQGVGLEISVEHLEVRYGPSLAVDDVSFDVAAGSALTILGANGAGKSSIARACSGLVQPSGGRILLGGSETTGWPAHNVRRAGVAYLPESRAIFPTLSVGENLKLATRLIQNEQSARSQAFDLFPILESRLGQSAGSLSGGEQQMLALACALISEPKVMIIDEPSLGLAPLVVEKVFETLGAARQRGMTMVLVEQFAHKALALSDQCLIMKRGHGVWFGPADDAAAVLEAVYLGDGESATTESVAAAGASRADA